MGAFQSMSPGLFGRCLRRGKHPIPLLLSPGLAVGVGSGVRGSNRRGAGTTHGALQKTKTRLVFGFFLFRRLFQRTGTPSTIVNYLLVQPFGYGRSDGQLVRGVRCTGAGYMQPLQVLLSHLQNTAIPQCVSFFVCFFCIMRSLTFDNMIRVRLLGCIDRVS